MRYIPVLAAMKKGEPATNLGQIQGSARVLTTDAKIRNNFYNASVPLIVVATSPRE